MDANQFYQSRQADWKALTQLLDRGQRGLAGLSPDELDRMGALYRLATSDLALAQRDYPDQRVTAYLNQLVARAHATIYQSQPLAVGRLWTFAARGFPRAYREALPFILAAMALLIIPALAAGLSTAWQPASARWLLPVEVQDLIPSIEKKELWTKIPVADRPYASAFIMQNNIQVAFLAFGGGMLAGLYTVWTLVFNGLILGGLTGLTAHYGIGFDLWTFVIGHGVIELSVIAIAGGSGLMLGWAMLQPGLMRRRDALALAARRAVRLVIGCVPLLVVAGTIEGFISPSEALPWPVHWAIGLGSGALLYAYLLLAGREPRRGQRPT
jgi:uncharacterized membrane protein SpoIIM required for sporulation